MLDKTIVLCIVEAPTQHHCTHDSPYRDKQLPCLSQDVLLMGLTYTSCNHVCKVIYNH